MQYNDLVKNRLRRIEGQIRGVLAMMDNDRACKDVITQLSAIRSAVDKSIATIVAENLEDCIRREMENNETSTSDAVKQAVELLVKSR